MRCCLLVSLKLKLFFLAAVSGRAFRMEVNIRRGGISLRSDMAARRRIRLRPRAEKWYIRFATVVRLLQCGLMRVYLPVIRYSLVR